MGHHLLAQYSMILETAARRLTLCFVALFLPMALNGVWAQSKGYSLGADRVEVRTQAHWQAWGFTERYGDYNAVWLGAVQIHTSTAQRRIECGRLQLSH